MPDLRPIVTNAQVLTLLSQHFTMPVTDLTPVEGGSVARTFAFHTNEQDYIIRFNLDKMLNSNFPKEQYLWRKLASTHIPMPPVLQVGRLDDLHFAISHKMPGETLFHFTPPEIEQMFPQIMDLVDAVRHVNVADTQGYCVFDDQGRGMASSWRNVLKNVALEEREEDYYGKWHQLNALRFFAKSNQQQPYLWARTAILQKLQ